MEGCGFYVSGVKGPFFYVGFLTVNLDEVEGTVFIRGVV